MVKRVQPNLAVLLLLVSVMILIHNKITSQVDTPSKMQHINRQDDGESEEIQLADVRDNENEIRGKEIGVNKDYYMNAMKKEAKDETKEKSRDDRRPISGSEDQCRATWLGMLPPSLQQAEDSWRYGHMTCDKLLFGNISSDTVYNQAQQVMKLHKMQTPDYEKVILSEGCDKFKYDQSYHLKPVNQEEADFPIAFNILMHKDITQFELLLRSIYRPQNSYCIHVDIKTDKDVKDAVQAIVGCFDNVFIASRLERVVYAGYTRLQADINCMEDQVNSPIQWKYVLNIAGSEMPAKSNLQMVRILKIYNGANDVEGLTKFRVIKKRFYWKWYEDPESLTDYKMKQSEVRHDEPPHNLTILRGNSCGVFSRRFIEWVVNDPVPQDLLRWSVDTQSPDEQYWSTLNHMFANPHIQPPGGYSGDPMEKAWLAKYVSWEGSDPCHGRYLHAICVFGIKDLPHLITRKEFTFNKFSSNFEPFTQECIGRWIEYQSQCEPPFDESYYRSLPFINE